MKSKNENLPDTFEKLDQIASGKQPGYVQEFSNATARGRALIKSTEARKGTTTFPPARQVTGKAHKP
jgi:hypothetical protein